MESHQKRGKEPKSYMSPTFCASLKSKNTVMQTPLSYNNLRKQMNVDVGSQLARFSTSLKAKSTVTQTPRAYNNIRKPMNEDVCSQVARVLKDIHNKDAKMKVEALKKLSKCFKNITKEVFVQIVPIWSFAYKKLLLERNTDVRRATHDTMTSLITDVGGSLAPHLKSLMGPWWFSQFDPVSEISFQDALAAQERLGSLVLYTSEIFFYLEENLKLTPQTIYDKTTPMDELEEMHQHVVSSSLLALAKLVYVLVVKNGSKARAVSSAEKMFSALKYFTEFLKSESAVIRSATYSALGSFIKHIPEVVKEENLFIISAAILGSFQEKDPTCHSSMWETLLLFSKEYPESWAPASIQKTVLNQFWQFLRNGCYGTQQVACPMLVPFINTMPPESLKGNEFFLNFFQNLWVGRHTSYSSSADSLAFFKAFGECFIWEIQNASRYFDGEDAVHQFRVGLVVSILVDLMWKGFLLLDSSKSQDGVLPQKSSSGSPEQNIQSSSQGQKLEKQNTKLPLHYMQNLGECIIEILSVLSGVEHSLLSTFCTTFLENSIEFVKETEQSRSSEQVNQVVSFLVLLQKHARNKDETWPLVYLTGPMLTKVFPVIKSLESPDAVRILSLSVAIFGPRRIVSQLHNNSEEVSSGAPSKEGDNDYETKHFMQVFKETFLPWCLHQSSLCWYTTGPSTCFT